MKNVIIMLSGLLSLLFLLHCAGGQKADTDKAVIACKENCSITSDECIKKALKNEAKKAACEAVKNKCYNDCDINPDKKPTPKKKPVKK